MNDLRARIAQIVERDRTRIDGERGAERGSDRNPLYATVDPPASGRYPVARGPSAGADVPGLRYEVREQRFAIDDLESEVVDCDPPLAHFETGT